MIKNADLRAVSWATGAFWGVPKYARVKVTKGKYCSWLKSGFLGSRLSAGTIHASRSYTRSIRVESVGSANRAGIFYSTLLLHPAFQLYGLVPGCAR